MKEAPTDYEIQVGDIITAKNWMGKSKWVVYRITKKFCFIKYKSGGEGKFPRKYTWSFQPYPKDTWNTTEYTVLIKED